MTWASRRVLLVSTNSMQPGAHRTREHETKERAPSSFVWVGSGCAAGCVRQGGREVGRWAGGEGGRRAFGWSHGRHSDDIGVVPLLIAPRRG